MFSGSVDFDEERLDGLDAVEVLGTEEHVTGLGQRREALVELQSVDGVHELQDPGGYGRRVRGDWHCVGLLIRLRATRLGRR